MLRRLMAHPFFAEEPPRSTGRETFGRPMLQRLISDDPPTSDQGWAGLVATLTALTTRSIAHAYEHWVLPRGVDEIFIMGGGAHNKTLVSMLREAFAPLAVFADDELGVAPDAREAVAFAALAWAHLNGLPANVPGSTGARGERVLGSFTPGRGR